MEETPHAHCLKWPLQADSLCLHWLPHSALQFLQRHFNFHHEPEERFMGYFMKEHDIYVGSLQEKLNLRFAPSLGSKELHGGLDEMVELQKEFDIFKSGRSFEKSISALNLTGLSNAETKNRFHR
ncbi:MAG: hypothetical protein ABI907_10190, partial [Ramlibacter sp.]